MALETDFQEIPEFKCESSRETDESPGRIVDVGSRNIESRSLL
jgi:hypothetical protein